MSTMYEDSVSSNRILMQSTWLSRDSRCEGRSWFSLRPIVGSVLLPRNSLTASGCPRYTARWITVFLVPSVIKTRIPRLETAMMMTLSFLNPLFAFFRNLGRLLIQKEHSHYTQARDCDEHIRTEKSLVIDTGFTEHWQDGLGYPMDINYQ